MRLHTGTRKEHMYPMGKDTCAYAHHLLLDYRDESCNEEKRIRPVTTRYGDHKVLVNGQEQQPINL